MTDLFDRYQVIDVDTHLTEPPDVWTARMPAALHDRRAPHRARRRPGRVDGRRRAASARPATTRWPAATASCRRRSRRPTTTSPPSMYDADGPRWRSSTSEGIDAQVLYPNVGGFGNGYFLRLGDRDARRWPCVRAYNDFLTDWCCAAPDRLIADHRRCRSGTSTSRSPSCTAASPTATGRSTSATSRRTTASRRSPTATGTRSGPRPRRRACRSASTSAAGRWARQFDDTAGWAG